MFRLAINTLRYRLASFIGVFIAIFAGVAIIMACGGLMETGIRLNAAPERLAAPIIVSRDYETIERARLTDKTVEKVKKVSGIGQIISDEPFAASIDSVAASARGLYGHSWEAAALTPYHLKTGTAPTADNQLVLDNASAQTAKLAVGNTVKVAIKGKEQSFIVSGIAETSSNYKQPALFFAPAFSAAQRTGLQPDALGIVPARGVAIEKVKHDLEVALTSENALVLTGDDRGLAEYAGMSGAREVLIAGSAPFGGNTIVVVAFVVASILGLSIRQRTREMALLQTIGATPEQVRRMVVIEVMTIAAVAVVAAIIPGQWLGEFMLTTLKSNGLVPAQVMFYQGFIPILIGVVVGLVSALIASFVAARHATKIQPIEALSEISTQKKWFSATKLVLAIIGILGGLALAVVTALIMRGAIASSTAGPAVLPWLMAFGLLAPALIIPGLKLLARPLEGLFSRASGYLAVKNISVRYLQAASMVTPIMLASALALSMLYQQTTLNTMAEKAYTQDVRANGLVQTDDNGVSIAAAQSIAQLPGVAASSPLITSEGRFLDNNGAPFEDSFRLQGIAPQGDSTLFDNKILEGSLANLTGNTIALSKQTANALNRHVGDTLTVRLGDGSDVSLKLVALYQSPSGFESGLMPAATLLPHTASGLISSVVVQTQSGVDPASLQQPVASLVGSSAVRISGPGALTQTIRSQTSVLSWVNMLFTIMVTLYALLFLINTAIITIMARRREFALQQLIGSTRKEIFLMIGAEAMSLSLIGVVAGMLVASVSLVSFSLAINGTPFPQGPWSILLGVLIGAVALNGLVSLLATRFALRVQPIKAAANRE